MHARLDTVYSLLQKQNTMTRKFAGKWSTIAAGRTCIPRMFLALGLTVFAPLAAASGGKLLETAGVTQVEGSGGGGLVPWAILSGYDTREEWSLQTYFSKLSLDDFRMQSYGASLSAYDRVEISLSEQLLDLRTITADEREIRQQTFGVKARVFGDFVYGDWPQISVGLQHKTLADGLIAGALGAQDDNSGTDVYVAMARAHLGAVGGYNGFWNLTLRGTKANQFGLLGFGGDDNNSYEVMAEVAAGVLFSRQLAAGIEYRQKPDNLSAVKEDDTYNVFLAYFPNKNLNLTLAWVVLGDVAGAPDQDGLYVSLTGYLW